MKKSVRVAETIQGNKKGNGSSRIKKDDSSQLSGSLFDRIVFLQRTIGNQGVERLFRLGALHAVIQQGGAGTIQRQATPRAGKPASCPVTPITPITDADALAMEGGTRVVWNNTVANLQTRANNLVDLIRGAGGTAGITSCLSSPQAYQNHLRDVWNKARALRGHPQTACDTVRAAVNAEMANHGLRVNRPVGRVSNHRAGNAVDINWALPATGPMQPVNCLRPPAARGRLQRKSGALTAWPERPG